MLNSLLWWRKLRNPDLAHQVDALRQEVVWFLVAMIAVTYGAWHVVRVPIDGGASEVMDHSVRHWLLFAIVMAGLVLTVQLQRRRPRLAPICLLVTSALSIAAAAWLLKTPEVLALVPLLALVAAVLLHPLAGLVAGAGTIGLLGGLWAAGPLAFIASDRLVQAAVVSLLTLAVAWALGRILVTAIEASSASRAEAWQHAQEARANRAELVQALKQLDLAYYRLQRANAALELAWKAADAAERSKTEFVTNISHELRTPLNLIIGFSEMILTSPESYGTPLPVAYRGDMNAVYRSAQHLLTLTNDVIDLARVGMDRLALAREPIDIGETIGDACAIVRAYIETKGLALHLMVEPDLPVLQADRLRLRQVLLNLLTNAARFTERGAITVSAERAGQWVRISVADTGAGIPADQLPRVFEEFYTEGGAPPAGGLGGVGLGLPLSKRLVELHGGQIGVESTPGMGTRFWFELPILTSEPAAGTVSRPPRRLAPSDLPERILVLADPDPLFLEFLRRHLTGFHVIAAANLLAATAVAGECRALAILTDEPAASIAQHDAPAPVVSLPMPRNAYLGARQGVVAHLVKPVTRTALYETLGAIEGTVVDVLIVDDDRRFVRLLTRMLQTDPAGRRYTVRTAYDGRTALDLMQANRPGLVLLDLTLPELDGAGLLTAMRAIPALADVPVVIISAQDRLLEAFPLRGPLSIATPDGFGPENLLRIIDGVVGQLTPPRPEPVGDAEDWSPRHEPVRLP